ncbi:23574_t:CDS:1, partial [Cetraspora pellucida]
MIEVIINVFALEIKSVHNKSKRNKVEIIPVTINAERSTNKDDILQLFNVNNDYSNKDIDGDCIIMSEGYQ